MGLPRRSEPPRGWQLELLPLLVRCHFLISVSERSYRRVALERNPTVSRTIITSNKLERYQECSWRSQLFLESVTGGLFKLCYEKGMSGEDLSGVSAFLSGRSPPAPPSSLTHPLTLRCPTLSQRVPIIFSFGPLVSPLLTRMLSWSRPVGILRLPASPRGGGRRASLTVVNHRAGGQRCSAVLALVALYAGWPCRPRPPRVPGRRPPVSPENIRLQAPASLLATAAPTFALQRPLRRSTVQHSRSP
jgi:hypothetical protein